MKRREFIKSAFYFAAANAFAAERPPNIVFILADELGIGNLSCYGADNFATPNVDRLAQGGTRFTHAYAAPLSGPSRSLILTGRYAFRTGATNQDASAALRPSAETMLPKLLKPAGYASAAIGQWNFPDGPREFGFDEYLRFTGSGVYWNTQAKGKTYDVNGETRSLRDREYMPDVMHAFVADFMVRHRDKPFYAFYSLSQMHGDIQPTPDTSQTERDLYSENIAYMDKLIGKLTGELDRLKLRNDTLIVFTSDSGTGSVYAGESTVSGRRLAGEKGSLLEGGALVPLVANWPSRVPAGIVTADLVDATDFLPTLAEVVGARLPEDGLIDGRSFAPQLYGRKGRPREWIYIQLGANWYVREAWWKLNQERQLFDMSHAPFEERAVAADTKNPAAVAARQRLQAVLDKLDPAGGIQDNGDGSGRHAGRNTHTKKKRQAH